MSEAEAYPVGLVGRAVDSFLVCDVEGTCERIEGEFTKLAFA